MRVGRLSFEVTGPRENRDPRRNRRKYAGAALFLAAIFALDRTAPTVARSGVIPNPPAGPGAPVVTPIARVVAAPGRLTFAALTLGATSPPQRVTFQNTGDADGSLGKITISDAMSFRFAMVSCLDGQIPAHSECYGEVRFHPSVPGTSMAILTRAGSEAVELTGVGNTPVVVPETPAAQFDQKIYSYGTMYNGASLTKLPALKNTGKVAIPDIRFRLEGDHIEDFAQHTDCMELAKSEACGVSVTFTAGHDGAHEVWLVASSGGRELDRAELDATVQPRPQPRADVSPNPLMFDDKQRKQAFYVRNNGDADLKIDQFSFDNQNDFSVDPSQCLRMSVLARGESCAVVVAFKGRKAAEGFVSVLDNDPSRTQKVYLSANVPPSQTKNRVAELIAQGLITAITDKLSQPGGGDQPQKPVRPSAPPPTPVKPNETFRRMMAPSKSTNY